MSKRRNRPAEQQIETRAPVSTQCESGVCNIMFGEVANCASLNVRKEPAPTASIIDVLANKATVEITGDFGDFYGVSTENGISGFCMKKFIEIL